MFPSSGIGGADRNVRLLCCFERGNERPLWRKNQRWTVYIYIYIHDDWFVIRNNKGSDKFLAGIGFAWYKRFDLSTIANNRPRTLDRLFRLFLVTLLISFKFVLDVIAPWNYVFRSRSFYILIPPGFTLTILFTIFEKVYIFPFKFA